MSLVLLLQACDEAPAGTDPALVDAVAELHLADAVAETDSLDAAAARALRAEALALHGLDSAALADRLRALAAQPDALGALYDSVALQLTLERQGARRAAGADSAAAPSESLF